MQVQMQVKKKPDILVVLALVLGIGITLSSVGNSGQSDNQLEQSAGQESADSSNLKEDKQVATNG